MSSTYQTTEPGSGTSGDIWIDSDSDALYNFVPVVATLNRWRKTVTGGQTSLTGADDNSMTLAYTPGEEQVFLNGVMLVRGQDYTGADGVTIGGLLALYANDVVEVHSRVLQGIADTYTQAQADARYVSKTAPGSVVQVLNVTKTDAQVISGAQWNDISGLSLSITPRYVSSKILVIADVKAAGDTDASVVRSRVLRDSTAVGIGDAASSRPRSLSEFYMASGAGPFYVAQLGGNIWDSPNTTSAITYKVQLGGDLNSSTVFINRTEGDRDNAYYDGRFISSITLMEIAQ
jgi:hypothetical protein